MVGNVSLSRLEANEQDADLTEILAEVIQKQQTGQATDVNAYVAAHPECSDRLAQLLPTMKTLADLGHPLPNVTQLSRHSNSWRRFVEICGRERALASDAEVLFEVNRPKADVEVCTHSSECAQREIRRRLFERLFGVVIESATAIHTANPLGPSAPADSLELLDRL